MPALDFASFCRMVGLKTGIKTGVAYPLAAVNVAGSLEPKFHFHFIFLPLRLTFQVVTGAVHRDRMAL